MTPAELRAICDSLNDECGTGGKTKLAPMLGWYHSTVWRKINGKSRITPSDELAILKAIEAEGKQDGLMAEEVDATIPSGW
jgi:hypothetical protein